MKGGNRPRDALLGEPLLHVRILQNIVIIVAGKEIAAPHTPKGNDGNHRKDEAQNGNLPRLMGWGSYRNGLPGRRLWRALDLGFALSRFLRHDGQSSIISR